MLRELEEESNKMDGFDRFYPISTTAIVICSRLCDVIGLSEGMRGAIPPAALEKLLADRDLELDQGRLEHEVALFAERTDVAEELARLTSHCDQFVELMQSTGPSHGRKLDFLLQEMAREVNTLGAKTPEVEVTRSVVELKADVERMREQVQNVL